MGRVSYVGRISGSQVAEIFRANRSSIFSQNIRNYIGDNLTNRGIRKTALNSPGDFFFFNNGISALATRVTEDNNDDRTLICNEFSIINGAQTVRSLQKAHDEDPDALQDVRVLIRITEAIPKQVDPAFFYSITKFNNTQNAIRISDFRSNDRVQLDIADKFDRLPARGGRRFRYRNKRSGERDANRIVINMDEFTKATHSFLIGPDDVFGGSQYLFDASKDGGYLKIYGSGGEILPALTDAQFRRLVGVWFICEYVRDIWKQEVEASPSEALERRWMVFFAVGESMRIVHGNLGLPLEAALEKAADPGWYAEPDSNRIKAVARRYCKLAFRALKGAYGEASGHENFRHRNWFRDPTTLVSVRKLLSDLWDIISENADDYSLVAAKPDVART